MSNIIYNNKALTTTDILGMTGYYLSWNGTIFSNYYTLSYIVKDSWSKGYAASFNTITHKTQQWTIAQSASGQCISLCGNSILTNSQYDALYSTIWIQPPKVDFYDVDCPAENVTFYGNIDINLIYSSLNAHNDMFGKHFVDIVIDPGRATCGFYDYSSSLPDPSKSVYPLHATRRNLGGNNTICLRFDVYNSMLNNYSLSTMPYDIVLSFYMPNVTESTYDDPDSFDENSTYPSSAATFNNFQITISCDDRGDVNSYMSIEEGNAMTAVPASFMVIFKYGFDYDAYEEDDTSGLWPVYMYDVQFVPLNSKAMMYAKITPGHTQYT